LPDGPAIECGCPQCGHTPSPRKVALAPKGLFRPLQPLLGRAAVKDYVSSLGTETHEWLLALYLNKDFRLIAFETVARGDYSSCDPRFWHLINCAKALDAAGFVLVHNHPSGDPRPSPADINLTRSLAQLSRDLDVPLLDHFIIAGDELREVGCW
jgi:DNA repair protein RadC